MVLLRRIIGETLRTRRRAQHRTLRDVSASANVSLGYLSEIERGQKEASSELLSSICNALEVPLSDVLGDVTVEVAREENVVERLETMPRDPSRLRPVSLLRPLSRLDEHRRVDPAPAPRQPEPLNRSAELTPPVSLAEARAKRARTRTTAPKASVAA